MTDILAEAIGVAQEMSDGTGVWSLADCVEAALKSAYPQAPRAETEVRRAKAICAALGWDWDDRDFDTQLRCRRAALADYRADPLWIALYVTSPSEPSDAPAPKA